MKIKAGSLFLTLGLAITMAVVIIASITGCAGGPFSSNLTGSPPYVKPTAHGDDHTQPVFTSPTTTPATTNLPAGS